MRQNGPKKVKNLIKLGTFGPTKHIVYEIKPFYHPITLVKKVPQAYKNLNPAPEMERQKKITLPSHGSSDSVQVGKSSVDVVGGKQDLRFWPPYNDLKLKENDNFLV